MPVTLEQKSRHSAGSTRKNRAIATACSLSINNDCCCDGLPFWTISIFAPGTAASIRDLICSSDSIRTFSTLSFEHRGLKHVPIRRRFQVVFAKCRHGELTRLIRLEKLGFICAGQFLIVNLALQFHECVKQCLRARRTAGDVNIDRNVTVDALEHIVSLLEWPT